ncbi:DUF3794 domain-containing protein [Pontibacillus sp. HMF3514]|uniref:DUF3794 domain-containing protein n=1 Tax=Pontibacillus sp. HMF3514 TaxID=2692425 RepID=UPI00131FA8B6|nr:DUF3794 domain-containing protein [Pontibacillus sp. HMF3514]QHE54118.1 DUF3794 domain-containing protein [Pontibacillus sp. HMF3514]
MALTFTDVFKQLPINSKLIIPPQKPDIECILDSNVEVEITKKEVIDTPLNYPEDPTEPLRKVILTGKVKIIIKYSALVPSQKVHAAHFEVPFCTLIEWPDGPPQGTPITVEPVIEKKVFKREDERKIYKALLIRFDVYR